MNGYIVCTTPRSGSTLLCSLLAATGRAGQPCSYYHEPRFMQDWANAWNLSGQADLVPSGYDAAYLAAVLRAGRGGSPVFAMRLQHRFLDSLVETLTKLYHAARSDAERFGCAFGAVRYVHLFREDKVAQAVSMVMACQTGLWHRHSDGSERERTAPPAEPVYDFAAIAAEVASLIDSDRGWRAWFARERIEPLHLSYEKLANNPNATVSELCDALAISAPNTASLRPLTAKLDGEINQAWIKRYRQAENR